LEGVSVVILDFLVEGAKVFQQSQAVMLALLGMELHAENVVVLDACAEFFTVLASRDDGR
jgi:hypothetical protein